MVPPIARNPLTRYYGQNDLHFVTFSCHRRHPPLGTAEARDLFVAMLDEVRHRYAFRLIGYVVMPEHVHLLMSEPAAKNPSIAIQSLKQKSAKELLERIGLRGDPTERLPFWQRRFYDFNVWTEGKLREKLDYVHRNPMERGLVSDPNDWPWSSWSYYEKRESEKIRIDPVSW